VGAIASSARIEGPAERRARAGTALALDMESAWLAAAAGDRPLAVLRVVVDAEGRRLADPRIARAGVRALRSLRAARGALADWGAAVGSRAVVLAGARSFCAGVERAIEIVEPALARGGTPVYVRRQMVHNKHVVAELKHRARYVEELASLGPVTVAEQTTSVGPRRVRLPEELSIA
jgi:4-hydroxy-3-methylbut-2-enyl diphosphate reductase